MRILLILILSAALINLGACSSMSGNVVPQSGPAMEKVYDSMNKQAENTDISFNEKNKQDLKKFRHRQIQSKPLSLSNSTFHKIPNPELPLYIYPHLAGRDQIPVPGYFTVFNAYEKDHYRL